MAAQKIYEGTLEEITARYGEELRGRRLQVLVEAEPEQIERSISEKIDMLTKWAFGRPPFPVHLSDEAIERESIYEGRP